MRMEMVPTMRPTRAMFFCEMRLVANAKALGGVDMGNTMALDAATATVMSTVGVPPMTSSLSPMARQTSARILNSSSPSLSTMLL